MSNFPEDTFARREPAGVRDPLTATWSRQTFIARLSERAERACHDGIAFGVCLVDIDHFKNVNLSHGPICGDDALREVSQRLVRTNCRAVGHEALVGRYDGDAFVVLVETASLDALGAAAEALHAAVGSAACRGGLRLTASVGGALARIGEAAEDVLMRAEQAVYLAKQFGRDRVELGCGPAQRRAPAAVRPLARSA